jgi:virginiamycin B lyase
MKAHNPGSPNRVTGWLVTIAVLVVATACILVILRNLSPTVTSTFNGGGGVPYIPNPEPIGITAGPDGALWFTEHWRDVIGRITTSGQLREFPLPAGTGAPSIPQGVEITTGPDGALWFINSGGNEIGRITTSGQVRVFRLPTARSQPSEITTGPDGALWFTEYNVGKIGRITTRGQLSEFPLSNPGVSD